MGGLAEATRRSPDPADFRIEWNAENQLTRVTKDSVDVASFKYDPLGRRIEKSVPGGTYSFTYDDRDILRETLDDGTALTAHTYLHGPFSDEVLAREESSGSRTYFHADGLGSITSVTDSGGTVTFERRYDAWGNLEQGGAVPGYAFTGREWDPETGLYYYRARYYEPAAGRFVSEDPISFWADVNFYAYVLGRPTTAVDPLGLDVAVIVGKPQGKNRFGHIALAVTGEGVYTSGTPEPFGSSATQYIRNQAKYRDSVVYILPTSREQDQAVVREFLRAAKEGHSAWRNNCADIVGAALKAGGLLGGRAVAKLPGLIESYMLRRVAQGEVAGIIQIPEGASEGWELVDELMGPLNPAEQE